jgi:hypothetical protein
LRTGRSVEVEVHLARAVSLDSIRIVAQRTKYPEFERRRRSGFGRYMTEEDIGQRNPMELSDLLRTAAGFRVYGWGLDARIETTRALGSATGFEIPCSGVNVVIDGMQRQDINWLRPHDVAGMEFYPGPAGAPVQYDSRCGLVVIWTKR